MKRCGISRGKGLKPRATALSRRGALLRGAAISRAAAKPKPPKARVLDEPTMAELRPIVFAHANGCCDMCGKRLPFQWECHHRKLKSQGGLDTRPNLLALDYRCHAYAHEHRTWARVRGYIVHPNTDPSAYPVLRHGRTWQQPTADGWLPADPPDDYERNAA